MAATTKTARHSKKNKAKKALKQAPQPQIAKEPSVRRFKPERYASFRLHRKIRPTTPPIKGGVELFFAAWRIVAKNWMLFLCLTLTFAVLNFVLVKGMTSSLNVVEAKEVLREIVDTDMATITIATSLFGALLGSAGSSTTAGGSVYQSLILVVTSLTTIWALRQITTGKYVRVRETFYNGLYPIAVFICVLFVIGVQLLPLAVGVWLYSALISGGVAITLIEKTVTVLLFAALSLLSFYMVSSSLFALFVSTLPNMTPMRALRSARQLVIHRRWRVIGRIVLLLVSLPILSALIMLPLIIWVASIAELVFFLLSIFGTLFTVTYMYLLYRELLNE